jgi:predicted nucleic acid-binding protein
LHQHHRRRGIALRGCKERVAEARGAARSGTWRAGRPPFEAAADLAYGLIRTRLEQIGRPIGGNDLLIAAQAVSLGYTIVTDNEGEFARVDGLSRENWFKPQ